MPIYSLTWLPEVLEAAGLKVADVPGWRARGRADMTNVRGVMCHHTATRRSDQNMPTLGLITAGRPPRNGSPGLAGPLAQLGVGRDGTFYVVAAGRANHAGAGRWEGLINGNASFIGIEAENSGLADDPWPDVQMDAYQRGVAAILRKIGARANMCCGHKEYALPSGRKIDPSFDMALFRNGVAALLAGMPPRPLIPAHDDVQRPTLRRNARGPFVDELQQTLGVTPTGVFDAATEAATRVFQRRHGLVADGIVGPKTWRAIHPGAATTFGPLANGMPPADDAAHAPRVDGKNAVTPDGRRFAIRWRSGFVTLGETSLGEWLDGLSAPPDSVSRSVLRVVRAMSINEGDLEAINSYDGAFLSFGVFQWTAGSGDDPGELPVLIRDLKAADPGAYEDCFGRFGLDVNVSGAAAHVGSFVLAGRALRSAQDKSVLRDVVWAYRFWRAGHHESMRKCQLALATRRIGRFLNVTTAGRPLRDWLRSELGIALVLDEHVNRPGHVPATLEKAIGTLGAHGTVEPTAWTTNDEHRLIDAYRQARTRTSMTDPESRAAKIAAFVDRSALSGDRGSFA